MEATEEIDLHVVADKVCRSRYNAYAAMWSIGHLSFHHGNRLRTALHAHLEHSMSSLGVSRHHKRRKKIPPASAQQRKKSADSVGEQLLLAAAAGGITKVQQLVQQQGANVNQQIGPLSRTALHAAAESGHASCCQVLLEQLGADADVCDTMGVSAIMLASKHGHHEVMKVLLDAGADPFAVDQSGSNALLLAASCGSAQSIRLLLQEGHVDADYHNSDLGGGEHALLLSAEAGWEECVVLLLAAGAKVNRTDKEGRTALWVASRNGHDAVVHLLLARPHIKHIRHFITHTLPAQEAQAAGRAALAALLAAHMAQHQTAMQPSHGAIAAKTSRMQQQYCGVRRRWQQTEHQQQQQQWLSSPTRHTGDEQPLQQQRHKRQKYQCCQQRPQQIELQQQQPGLEQHSLCDKAASGACPAVGLVTSLHVESGLFSPPGHQHGVSVAGSGLPGWQPRHIGLAY